MRVAFLGGSFNPPHMAHLFLAVSALASGEVDSVWVIPCPAHAFQKQLAPFEHRLAMAHLAFDWLGPRVVVSDVEAHLAKPSRTFHTLSHLAATHPDCSFRLLVGADIPLERERWYRIADVEAMAPPLVFGRSGVEGQEGLTLPPISSTDIRRRVRAHLPLLNLVPASVEAYMVEHGLYLDSRD